MSWALSSCMRRPLFSPEVSVTIFANWRRPLALAALAAGWHVAGGAAAQHVLAPGEFEEWYLRLNGVSEAMQASLYVYEIGEGPTVIVLHGGFGGEHGYLVNLLRPLSDRYRFVFYDQRGSLRSRCRECEFSVDTHLADLEFLQDAVGVEKATIVAHSMGTWLAMAYAERRPEKVNGLVLLGAVPAVLTDGDRLGSSAAAAGFFDRPAIAEQLRVEGLDGESTGARHVSQAWRIRFAGTNLYHVDRWRQISGGMAFYAETAGAAAASTMPSHWDFRKALCQLPAGAAVVMGDHDYLDYPAAGWRRTADELGPVVTYTLIPQAGHRGWLDQPVAYETTLDQALAGVFQGRRSMTSEACITL